MSEKSIECACIKLIELRNNSAYREEGNSSRCEQDYIVPNKYADNVEDYIIEILKKHKVICLKTLTDEKLPSHCSIVYFTGIKWENKTNVFTKDRIKELTIAFAEQMNEEKEDKSKEELKDYGYQLTYALRRR